MHYEFWNLCHINLALNSISTNIVKSQLIVFRSLCPLMESREIQNESGQHLSFSGNTRPQTGGIHNLSQTKCLFKNKKKILF